MKVYFLMFGVFLLTTACNRSERKVEGSFYYWQQQFDLSNPEQNYTNHLDIKKLYIKFFDITWNSSANTPQPVAIIDFKNTPPKGLEIIPTVFITNETIRECNEPEIILLAHRMTKKINGLAKKHSLNTAQEIQIDCDWSPSTKEKFFLFLEKLKEQNPSINLSATIRLHQVKFYKKTGVPPVQRGMLMFYNVDEVRDTETKNSILDLEIAKKYLVNFDEYELPLDVALPIFRWGVLIRRGRVVKLINNLDFNDLQDTSKYQSISNTAFQVKSSHYLDGYYLYPDDEIRIEHVSMETLNETVELLKNEIRNQEMTVTYYHLDEAVLEYYSKESLKEIIEAFK